MRDCRLVEMAAIFHRSACHRCACAGVITQQGHFSIVCKHIHTLAGVRMSYTSGGGGGGLQLLHRPILIQLFLASVSKE